MPKIICCFALCLTLAGCPTLDLITLTAGEAQLLTDNTESTLEIQQLFTKYAFEAARGDLTLVGLTYDPPTAQNNWTGTISSTGGAFQFGTGDLNLTFNVAGDAGPTDPYSVDLSDDTQVIVDVVGTFLGAKDGVPVDLSTTFNATTLPLQNALNDATARVNGVFDIDYGGYIAAIQATDVDIAFDIANGQITSVLGDITAQIDIPNFAFDADVVLTGLGNSVDIGIEVANTVIGYVLSLGSLFP